MTDKQEYVVWLTRLNPTSDFDDITVIVKANSEEEAGQIAAIDLDTGKWEVGQINTRVEWEEIYQCEAGDMSEFK